MRIAVIGLDAFGAKATEALLEDGHEVAAIFTSHVVKRAAPLKEMAEQHAIPFHQTERMRNPEVVAGFKELEVDLGIMAFVTDIVPIEILTCPTLGTIQFHPSLLPRHRGSSAINWAIIKGETETGITIFWPDDGIDTGPILLQKRVDILPDDTLGSLYFNRLFPMGIDAIVESVRLVATGNAPKTMQNDSMSTYDPPCEEEHSLIDWGMPVSEVFNLIRGTNPQPGATTYYKNTKLKIYDSSRWEQPVEKPPGTVIEVTDEGFVVAACGGVIQVRRVKQQGQPKLSAGNYARDTGMKPGEKLHD